MPTSFNIASVTASHAGMEILRAEATAEGFQFVDRLVCDWQTGSNKFDRPGEFFLGALSEGDLIGVCGLNRDPYSGLPRAGRVRHLYVRRSSRRLGVATALVRHLLDLASDHFDIIRLRTDTEQATAVYRRLGFTAAPDETASHVMRLR
jgi:GNAT superfamily N-acetyltransferase